MPKRFSKRKNITRDPRYEKSEVYPAMWLKLSLRLHKRRGSPRIHPTPQVPSHVLFVQPFSSALSQISQERQSMECQEMLRAERTLMQKVHPFSRNYAHCIFVYLFVGSPIIIDSLALVPLFYATRFSKWKAKTRGTNLMEVISPDSPRATVHMLVQVHLVL